MSFTYDENAPLEHEDAPKSGRPLFHSVGKALSQGIMQGFAGLRRGPSKEKSALAQGTAAGAHAAPGDGAAQESIVAASAASAPEAVVEVARVVEPKASAEVLAEAVRAIPLVPVAADAFVADAAAGARRRAGRRAGAGSNGHSSTVALLDPPPVAVTAPVAMATEEEVPALAAADVDVELASNGALRKVTPGEVEPNIEKLREVARLEQERMRAEAEIARARDAANADIEHDRLAVEEEARTRGRAFTQTWWVRLDPDLDPGDARTRRGLATSLGRSGAPWALKLARIALEQEDDATVRARLLGALVMLGAGDDYAPFRAAEQRGNAVELAALKQLFGESFPWAGNA
jgi:hypothetical protein